MSMLRGREANGGLAFGATDATSVNLRRGMDECRGVDRKVKPEFGAQGR
jgi:hypothetical protein